MSSQYSVPSTPPVRRRPFRRVPRLPVHPLTPVLALALLFGAVTQQGAPEQEVLGAGRPSNSKITTPVAAADRTSPVVASRSPAPGDPAVPVTAIVTAGFNEPVTGVGPWNFVLRDSAGAIVPASVTYTASTRVAALRPSRLLTAGRRYTVGLSESIRDRSGNPLRWTTWSFSTPAGTGYAPARTLVFQAGTYTGLRFGAGNVITARKTATLSRASSASTSMRATASGQSGSWFYVTNGIWAGYWVRETHWVYLPGSRPPAPAPVVPPPTNGGGHGTGGGDSHAPPAGAASCAGYPQPRIFLESHSWWQDGVAPVAPERRRHVHVATCFPQGQAVSGNLRLDVKITLHNNDGRVYRLRAEVREDDIVVDRDVNLSCPGSDCEISVPIDIPTAAASDGRKEVRVRAYVRRPNGTEYFPTTGWQAYFRNGKAAGASERDSDVIIGRGWYPTAEYANAEVASGNVSQLYGTVSGIWTPHVEMKPGTDGDPTTFSGAYIDPDFHHGHRGIVVMERSGGFEGSLSIDTRRLANGRHKLLLRSDAVCSDCAPAGINSGILVVWFTVAN